MTTAQQEAVDQRLDQHADAMEIVLSKLDDVVAIVKSHASIDRKILARLRELESIVLPDPDKQGTNRPSETPS